MSIARQIALAVTAAIMMVLPASALAAPSMDPLGVRMQGSPDNTYFVQVTSTIHDDCSQVPHGRRNSIGIERKFPGQHWKSIPIGIHHQELQVQRDASGVTSTRKFYLEASDFSYFTLKNGAFLPVKLRVVSKSRVVCGKLPFTPAMPKRITSLEPTVTGSG